MAEGEAPTGRGRRRRRGRRGKGRPPANEAPLDAARRLARERFGISRLRPEQEQALRAILAGQDTLAVLPTGFGKSLLYQLPALLVPRPTVVVSPLIALMADQEQALLRRRLPVVRIDSTLLVAQRREAFRRLEQGGPLVVLTTPETLESKSAGPAFDAARPSLLAIDEAHCISEWGHDFRPAYLRLAERVRALGQPTLIATTATATPRVRDDILERLAMREPALVLAPPYRKNLQFTAEVTPGAAKPAAAGKILRRLPRPGIVYCATTVEVDSLSAALAKTRIPTDRYHGRMTKAEREQMQQRFMKSGKKRVMIATSAFGMGIDKPDIRYVMHYQAPASLEQYVQEAGRGGRDGKPCRCALLFDPADLEVQRRLRARSRTRPDQLRRVAAALRAWSGEGRSVGAKDLALSAEVPGTTAASLLARLEELGVVEKAGRDWSLAVDPDELERAATDLARLLEVERYADERRLEAVRDYAIAEGCRSAFLRRYFGEEDPPACGVCDRCRAAGLRPEAAAEAPPKKKRRRRRSKQKAGGERRAGRPASDRR